MLGLQQILGDLQERDAEFAKIAVERAGAARLLTELPKRLDLARFAWDVETHRTWELAGLYSIVLGGHTRAWLSSGGCIGKCWRPKS